MNEVWNTVNELHKSVDSFFVGSVDDNGFPNIKVMFPTKNRQTIKVIYFSTNTSSRRVAQFRKNAKASVYFLDKENFKGVMLTGIMEVLEQQEIKSRFWNEGDEQYYSLGETDPDYCILKFTAEKGRYYHNLHSDDFIP